MNISFEIGTDSTNATVFGVFNSCAAYISVGQTGSGHASYDESAFVVSLLQNYTPKQLTFAMIDPKQVQLLPYNDSPYLFSPIAYTAKDSLELINKVLNEMTRRTTLSSDELANKKAIVVLIPEIADLMMIDSDFYNEAFIKIAQLGSRLRTYLYIGTQRPSADVMSEELLSNIPGRLVFKVASKVDSRRLLKSQDAEGLQIGEVLFSEDYGQSVVKVTVNYVSDAEVEALLKSL